MTATDDGTLLLRAILDNPAENTARLVYADWLNENAGTAGCVCHGGALYSHDSLFPGQTPVGVDAEGRLLYGTRCARCGGSGTVSDGRRERAEFIREAVAYPHCEFVRLTGGNPFQLLGIPEPEQGVVVGPRSDDPLVNDANRRTWMWGETEDFGCVVHDMVRELDYRVDRGFVCGVRCRAGTWLRHADFLTAAHPVVRVRLTTMSGRDIEAICDRVRERFGRQWFDGSQSMYDVLRAAWPRITFELLGE